VIELLPHKDGVLLPVRANPGARADELVDAHGGALRVRVTAPPEDGRANEAIARLLADQLALKKAQVHLHSGAGSRAKRFLVTGVTPAELRSRIACVLESTDPDS
jgi:uncharacterized protein (TIGR00251 family)